MEKRRLIRDVHPRINIFLKLNILSVISGFFIFIAIESGVNIYRFERVTGLGFDVLGKFYSVFYLVGFIFSTVALIFLIKKWMMGKPSRFWLAILWFPYFYIFNYISLSLFPFTDKGDIPSAGTGLIIISGIILYPFYLTFVNLFAAKE